MDIQTRSLPQLRIATVSGRIDHASAESLSSSLQALLAECKGAGQSLLLDFSGVDYISSVGLRALMVASRQAKAQGSKIAVAALQSIVKEVFAISRFDLVLPCYETVEAGMEALS